MLDADDRARLVDAVTLAHLTLAHPDGDRVTIVLPMDAGRCGRLLQTLGELGFEFE